MSRRWTPAPAAREAIVEPLREFVCGNCCVSVSSTSMPPFDRSLRLRTGPAVATPSDIFWALVGHVVAEDRAGGLDKVWLIAAHQIGHRGHRTI